MFAKHIQLHYCILIWPWFCSLQNSRTHRPWKLLTRYAQWRRVKWSMHKVGGREGGRNIIMDVQTFWNSLDRAGRKSQGPAILPSMPVRVSDKICCLCILFCTRNRKCNWYAGTSTVNSELDSASNDIYFLNMQLFPW